MKPELVSAKALGILFYITSTDTRISAENLSRVFEEGEKAIGSGLRELRKHGLTELRHESINGRVIKFTLVTKAGWELIANYMRMPAPNSPFIFKESHNSQNGDIDTSNEQLSKLILNIYKYKPNTFREDNLQIKSEVNTRDSHELSCPNCISVVTPLEQRLENEKIKQATYDSKKAKKHRVAIDKRQGRSKSTWSISDVCMEIAEVASNVWSLPPWRLSESRLVVAFTQVRRKWGTNGEIEMHAFDFFMKRVNPKEFPSVDALWQSFIYQFPEILPKIRAIYPSQEELAENEEIMKISARKLREFLDVGINMPSKDEVKKQDLEVGRLKRLVHHYRVMADNSHRSNDVDATNRYRKAQLRTDLDIAIIRNNQKAVTDLRNQISEMQSILDIPDGEFLI